MANGIRQDIRRLFGQIERGLTVEFRAEPQKDGEDKALTDISNLALDMHFPEIAEEPMLLKGAELLEGDIRVAKESKRTTTRKTTVSKKGMQKSDDGAEPKE